MKITEEGYNVVQKLIKFISPASRFLCLKYMVLAGYKCFATKLKVFEMTVGTVRIKHNNILSFFTFQQDDLLTLRTCTTFLSNLLFGCSGDLGDV